MIKHRVINLFLIITVLIGALPIVIFADKIGITKFSIPAICLLAFHILYGIAAFILRHKGNYLRFNHLLIRHFWFIVFEPNKDNTYTEEYTQQFYRMMAIYFIVIPMYIPCIFLTSTAAAMPIALVVFLIPQTLFISSEIRNLFSDIKLAKQKKSQEYEEKIEQERREEMGRWK